MSSSTKYFIGLIVFGLCFIASTGFTIRLAMLQGMVYERPAGTFAVTRSTTGLDSSQMILRTREGYDNCWLHVFGRDFLVDCDVL